MNEFKRSRDRISSASSSRRSSITAAPFIQNILLKKLDNFCKTYEIPEYYNTYILTYNLSEVGVNEIGEIAYEDEDHPKVEIIEEIQPTIELKRESSLFNFKDDSVKRRRFSDVDLEQPMTSGGKQQTRKLKSNTLKKRDRKFNRNKNTTKTVVKHRYSTTRKKYDSRVSKRTH